MKKFDWPSAFTRLYLVLITMSIGTLVFDGTDHIAVLIPVLIMSVLGLVTLYVGLKEGEKDARKKKKIKKVKDS